jgi:tetratricopeptide (TPR) repeat protein
MHDAPEDAAPLVEAWQVRQQFSTHMTGGQFALAAAMGERLLELKEAELGPSHADVATLRGIVAEAYLQMSVQDRAQQLLEQALADHEAAHGPSSPLLTKTLIRLARLHRKNASLDRVEPLLRRAIDIERNAAEPDAGELAHACHGLALLLVEQGKCDEAEEACRQALQVRETLFGPESGEAGEALGTLGVILQEKGAFTEAERIHLRALAIAENARGPDHFLNTSYISNLATLYLEQGDFERARPLFERALSIVEAQGPETPETVVILEGLGACYHEREDKERAEPTFRRALAIAESIYGPSHPAVARVLNNVVTKVKLTAGEAERLLRRALQILETAHGPDHPSLAPSLANLGAVLGRAGRFEEAHALLLRALRSHEASKGPDHLDVASILSILAALAEEQNDVPRALDLLHRAFAIKQKHLGLVHPSCVAEVVRASKLFLKAGELDEAEAFGEMAVNGSEKVFGPHHVQVEQALLLYAEALLGKNKPQKARPLLERALRIREKRHPDRPGMLIELLMKLSDVDVSLNRFERAEKSLRRLGEIFKRIPDPDGFNPFLGLVALGDLAIKRKDYRRGASLYQEALAGMERSASPRHPKLASLMYKLGNCHFQLGAFDKAQQMLERLLPIAEEFHGPDDPALVPALCSLATTYRKRGDPRADGVQQRAGAILEKQTQRTMGTAGNLRGGS